MKNTIICIFTIFLVSSCSPNKKFDKPISNLTPTEIADLVWNGKYPYEAFFIKKGDLRQFNLNRSDQKGAVSSLKAIKENLKYEFGNDATLFSDYFTFVEKTIEPVFLAESMNPPCRAQKIIYHLKKSSYEDDEGYIYSSLNFSFVELKPNQWKILALRHKLKM